MKVVRREINMENTPDRVCRWTTRTPEKDGAEKQPLAVCRNPKNAPPPTPLNSLFIDVYWHRRRLQRTTGNLSFKRIKYCGKRNREQAKVWVGELYGQGINMGWKADLGCKRITEMLSAISALHSSFLISFFTPVSWSSVTRPSIWRSKFPWSTVAHWSGSANLTGWLCLVWRLPLFFFFSSRSFFLCVLCVYLGCRSTPPSLSLWVNINVHGSRINYGCRRWRSEGTLLSRSIVPIPLQCLSEAKTPANLCIFIQLAKDQGEACFRANWPSWLSGISSFSSKKRSPCTSAASSQHFFSV